MSPGATGILIYNNFYGDVDNNVMTKVGSGVQTNNIRKESRTPEIFLYQLNQTPFAPGPTLLIKRLQLPNF
jgi:hypothetical protein